MELVSQFRCNGSDGYLAWLDNVLEIRETANYDFEGIDFDFRICSSPSQVKDLIFEKIRFLTAPEWLRDIVGIGKSSRWIIQITMISKLMILK